jgi:hypothetical protein
MQEIAEQQGTPMATLSVAISSVIFVASRLEQLTDTAAAANYKLDSAVKAALDDVSIEYRRRDADARHRRGSKTATSINAKT